jgi:hypothetical protein
MTIRAREAVAAQFLRKALADEVVGVPKLDAMARAVGLLGEGERITQAKLFRRAKDALGIRSVREGFGAGGRWFWELPRDRDEPAATTSGMSQPIRVARRVPADWVEGVARLDYQRPMTGVPRHRWCQFVDDCYSFIRSEWAERAAALGWNARALFGYHRNPLMYLGSAGLLWVMDGGKLVDLRRDWAIIDGPVHRSPRTFFRRNIDPEKTALPWTMPLVKTE